MAKAVTLGDDTDALAAMAGALSGAHLGVGAVPPRWLGRLEDGPKGAGYLRSLAERRHQRYRTAEPALPSGPTGGTLAPTRGGHPREPTE